MMLFHGSDHLFHPGDVVLPGNVVGKSNWPDMDVSWGVWVTPHPDIAAEYGRYVYEVEAGGTVTDWCEENGWERERANDEYVCDSATVVSMVLHAIRTEERQCRCGDQLTEANEDPAHPGLCYECAETE